MKEKNLPAVDARYWTAMLIASLFGTTLGDFISNSLHLGYVIGLAPLSFVLAAVFAAERFTSAATEIYYWAAIVLTRTMATNIADLATHRLKLNYAWIEIALIGLLAVLFFTQRASAPKNSGDSLLPKNDSVYWLMVLVASTIGTTLGDFLSDDLGLGVARASLVMALVLTAVFALQSRMNFSGKSVYWLLLIVIRVTGTVMGDLLSGEDGLKLGYLASAASMAMLLAALLAAWKPAARATVSS